MCLVFSPGWLMGCLNATKGNWKFMLKVQFKKIHCWIQHGSVCLSVHFLNKSQYDEMLFNVFCWNKVSHVYVSNITCDTQINTYKSLAHWPTSPFLLDCFTPYKKDVLHLCIILKNKHYHGAAPLRLSAIFNSISDLYHWKLLLSF